MPCCPSLVERCRKMEDSTQKIKLNIQTHRLGHVSSLFRPLPICCLRPLALTSTVLPFRKVCLEPCAIFSFSMKQPHLNHSFCFCGTSGHSLSSWALFYYFLHPNCLQAHHMCCHVIYYFTILQGWLLKTCPFFSSINRGIYAKLREDFLARRTYLQNSHTPQNS